MMFDMKKVLLLLMLLPVSDVFCMSRRPESQPRPTVVPAAAAPRASVTSAAPTQPALTPEDRALLTREELLLYSEIEECQNKMQVMLAQAENLREGNVMPQERSDTLFATLLSKVIPLVEIRGIGIYGYYNIKHSLILRQEEHNRAQARLNEEQAENEAIRQVLMESLG